MHEADVELAAVQVFQSFNFAARTGAEVDAAGERADLTRALLEGRVAAALHRLNPQIPHDEVEQVVRALLRPPHPTFVENNRWFHEQMTGGVEVTYRDAAAGETRGGGGGGGVRRGRRGRGKDSASAAADSRQRPHGTPGRGSA